MDPDATYVIVRDSQDPIERAEAAADLLAWLAKGGFWPTPTRTSLSEASWHRLVVLRCELAIALAVHPTPEPQKGSMI